MISNHALYRGDIGGDHLYIVANAPVNTGDHCHLTVDLDAPAAVLDSRRRGHLDQPSVGDIRTGDDSRWLLSGGALITDHLGRIAIGLRDGNAADPFAFTNIAAGRCDRRLRDHCFEELYSELILCVRRASDGWAQLTLDQTTPDLADLRRRRPAVSTWRPDVGEQPIKLMADASLLEVQDGPSRLTVQWLDQGRIEHQETLSGYVLVDRPNHTVEYRMKVRLDLSPFDDTAIFFAEGTGYALWRTAAQIQALVASEQVFGSTLVTPLLRKLVGLD